MGGISIAWLIGLGIISWRSVQRDHRPPMPGQLLGASGFFAVCAILAEYPPARTAATLLAFGIDIAAWLQAPLVTSPQPAGKPAKVPLRKPGIAPVPATA